jgi:hypothetical protein
VVSIEIAWFNGIHCSTFFGTRQDPENGLSGNTQGTVHHVTRAA